MDLRDCIENCIEEPECDYAVHKERMCMLYNGDQLHKMEEAGATLFAKKCHDTGKVTVIIELNLQKTGLWGFRPSLTQIGLYSNTQTEEC